MVITETKVNTRPNTSVRFFITPTATRPEIEKVREDIGQFTTVEQNGPNYAKKSNADGSMVYEVTVSDDGLVQTIKVTYSNLEIYSRVDTALSIALDYANKLYSETDDFVPPTGQQYIQTGIDQPFTCTTTYTYTDDTITAYPLFDSFISVLESSSNLESLTNDGTTVTAVHHYLNSEDFTENHWFDYRFVEGLHAGGVTRTIKYELV